MKSGGKLFVFAASTTRTGIEQGLAAGPGKSSIVKVEKS
jgi:hypothetical protein